jgi:hypothetical protein
VAEWLLYPMDAEDGLIGYFSRFFLNDFPGFNLFARKAKP